METPFPCVTLSTRGVWARGRILSWDPTSATSATQPRASMFRSLYGLVPLLTKATGSSHILSKNSVPSIPQQVVTLYLYVIYHLARHWMLYDFPLCTYREQTEGVNHPQTAVTRGKLNIWSIRHRDVSESGRIDITRNANGSVAANRACRLRERFPGLAQDHSPQHRSWRRTSRPGVLWVTLTEQAIHMYRMRNTGATATEEDESEIESLFSPPKPQRPARPLKGSAAPPKGG